MKNFRDTILTLLFFLLTYQLIFLSTPIYADETEQTEAVPQLVTLDLFVMSQCPWGTRAENIVYELKRRFGERSRVNLYYIATTEGTPNSHFVPTGQAEKTAETAEAAQTGLTGSTGKTVFRSMHGTPEVEEDIRQLLLGGEVVAT